MFFQRPKPPRDMVHFTAKTERITKPDEIAKTLRKLQVGRCILDIQISGYEAHNNSAVLRVYPRQGVLVLDELHSDEGHQALIQAQKFRASCRLNGVEYRFLATLQRVDKQGGIAMYFVPLPNVILHIQRRRDYRVPVASDAGLHLHIPQMENPNLLSNLNDISTGGMGASLNCQWAPSKGHILPQCAIILPSGDHIHSELEICFAQSDRLHNAMRFGGHFINMNPKAKKKLVSLVKQLERHYLRNHSS